MSDTLHNIVFPENISYGMTCTWGFNNILLTSVHGSEVVQRGWSKAKHIYTFNQDQMSDDITLLLRNFYLARYGEVYRFLFKDPLDYSITLESDFFIEDADVDSNFIADLNDYSVVKKYLDSALYEYQRKITRAKVNWVDAVKIPGTDSHYEISGNRAGDPSEDNITTVTAYRRCLTLDGNGDPSLDGFYITTESNSYELSFPLTNFLLVDPPPSEFLWEESHPGYDVPNYVFIKFNTAVPNGHTYFIRIECYYGHTDPSGYTKDGSALNLQRVIPSVSGHTYYGVASVEATQLKSYPEHSYCWYRNTSPKSAYWEGDCFCYRIICYRNTGGDPSLWTADSNGDPTGTTLLIWQSYTPWIQLVQSPVEDYSIPVTNEVITYVAGSGEVRGKKVVSIPEFYVPVRFTGAQNVSVDSYNNINWKSIKVVESGV